MPFPQKLRPQRSALVLLATLFIVVWNGRENKDGLTLNGKIENGESVNSATEIENGENEKSENTESDKTDRQIVLGVSDI